MSLKIIGNATRHVCFGDLSPGALFEYSGSVCMKTDAVKGEAVDLSDGEVLDFASGTQVVLLSGTLTVTK